MQSNLPARRGMTRQTEAARWLADVRRLDADCQVSAADAATLERFTSRQLFTARRIWEREIAKPPAQRQADPVGFAVRWVSENQAR